MLNEILNYFGLYTRTQYLHQVKEVGRALEFVMHLEKAVTGMTDPAKPIVVLSDYTRVNDILLQHGQQIITSPFAKNVEVSNVTCLPRRELV